MMPTCTNSHLDAHARAHSHACEHAPHAPGNHKVYADMKYPVTGSGTGSIAQRGTPSGATKSAHDRLWKKISSNPQSLGLVVCAT